MDTEQSVRIGFICDRVPDDDKTPPEALNKFGGRPVRLVIALLLFIARCNESGAETGVT